MDALAVSGIQLSPEKHFDQIVELRAEKRERLRGRNNVTSCRSPTRQFDTKLIKNELKEKRHLEFLRRRSVSPEPHTLRSTNRSSKTKASPKTFSVKHHSSISKSEMLHPNVLNTHTANGHPVMNITTNNSTTDGPSTSKWASLWSEQATLMTARTQPSTSTSAIKQPNQQRMSSADKNSHNGKILAILRNSLTRNCQMIPPTNNDEFFYYSPLEAQKLSIKTFIQTEKIHQRFSVQTENIPQRKTLRETSMQTESGLITIKESELQRLADYLQEALWREEAVKKKLAALQDSVSNLMNSSNKIWTARCSEDLLRNKIKALEAQLQVCLQKFPKDGVKKFVIQMEKQKLVYEEKALVALQKATQEKTEALSKAETLQEALITAKADALRWQSLYEELKLCSGQLRENQHLSNEQLQQLHSQVELSRAREAELREEVVSLRREKRELLNSICMLEEDNQMLTEEIQHLREGSNESHDFMMQGRLESEEAEAQLTLARRDSQAEEQLLHTQEKLRLKERECEELQTELYAVEQECQSSQARLSQCRDELRQLGHRHKRPTLCGSWWKMWFFFLLFLAEVAMLWLWYPPFREQVEDLYSDIETRIEDYLMEMASPQQSCCFRPI